MTPPKASQGGSPGDETSMAGVQGPTGSGEGSSPAYLHGDC